jgi:undecaprenyl phosphate N,N'-diacetylbacillosamine 1-phosphate transferase
LNNKRTLPLTLSGYYQEYFKRFFDRIVSAFLLITLSWLFLLIILVYLITFQFPIFFFQQRIGKDEKVFRMIKFRTLKTGSEPAGRRRFWLGDILRYLSLDELPQLVNVLKGDMSLVGPRPLPIRYMHLFSASQGRRHNVVPGLTGWAQVNGRHRISWDEKFSLDLFYVDHVSFSLDMKILLKTVFLLLSFRPDVSLEEEAFKGTDSVEN